MSQRRKALREQARREAKEAARVTTQSDRSEDTTASIGPLSDTSMDRLPGLVGTPVIARRDPPIQLAARDPAPNTGGAQLIIDGGTIRNAPGSAGFRFIGSGCIVLRNGATIERNVVATSEELIRRRPGDFLSGDQPLPRRVFRYNSEVAHQDLLHGRLRVGTLATFRKMEDVTRGDVTDSTFTAIHTLPEGRQQYRLSPTFQSSFELDVQTPIRVEGKARVVLNEQLPDALAYCASERLSREAAGSYAQCVEILDYLAFVSIVGEHVEAHYKQLAEKQRASLLRVYRLAGRVEYGEVVSDRPVERVQQTGLRKSRRFQHEAELRACWFGITAGPPLTLDEPYLAVDDTRLAKLVCQIDVPGRA